jgi:8-oxo-dGTP pyrophosphatase MutT (NUDIX family)
MKRHTRYQGAIINNHQILLIRHREYRSGRSYWVIPGGGMEPGETGEDCVRREMKEETDLDVQVLSLLMDEPDYPGGTYQRLKTYLCKPLKGEARPGFEPEPETASTYGIVEVKWFDLQSEAYWGSELVNDPITYPQLKNIRSILSYKVNNPRQTG